MKRNGMKLAAVLAMMLVVSMAFVPAVSAKTAEAQIEKIQLDVTNLKDVSYSDIHNMSEKEIESLMTAEQKKLFNDFAKQELSITEVGDDKIIKAPSIDANGEVFQQEVKMTLLSKTSDTELYLVDSGTETELVTIQHNGKDIIITGYEYDKTNAKTEYDISILKDYGEERYKVWTEDGYLRIWISPLWSTCGAGIICGVLPYAIVAVLAAIGIAVSLGPVTAVIIVLVFAAYAYYGNPHDASMDLWLDLDDLSRFEEKCSNWWPCDYGLIDGYAGINKDHYIPIPYGPV